MKDWTSTEGYSLVYGAESHGSSSGTTGVKIFVKARPDQLAVFDPVGDMKTPYVYLGTTADNIIEEMKMMAATRDPKTKERQLQMRQQFEQIFCEAHLHPFHMRMIPNEYCPKHCCITLPWFVVTSRLGPIKIGWRKRVISIDWRDSDVKADGSQLFKDENVTALDAGVHAWSNEKATAYLIRLKEAMDGAA
jgi:hypothetical protein